MPSSRHEEIVAAARVLAGTGLVSAFGHVSARDGASMTITPVGDLGEVDVANLVEVPLDATALPVGAPAEAWIHLQLYRVRADVDAVARAQPAPAFAVAATPTSLRPMHGQAAWLGRQVPVHDDARLLRTAALAEAAARRLPDGEALLLRGNGAVTVGATPGLAVTRMWLLAAACDVWLSTRPDGRPLSDTEIDSWRVVQDELLPRLWRHLQHTSRTEPYRFRPEGVTDDAAVAT